MRRGFYPLPLSPCLSSFPSPLRSLQRPKTDEPHIGPLPPFFYHVSFPLPFSPPAFKRHCSTARHTGQQNSILGQFLPCTLLPFPRPPSLFLLPLHMPILSAFHVAAVDLAEFFSSFPPLMLLLSLPLLTSGFLPSFSLLLLSIDSESRARSNDHLW